MAILWLIAVLQAIAGAVVLSRLSRGRERGAPLRAGVPAAADAVSIVIPARDEAERIGPLLAALAHCQVSVHEIIVVDDRSTDDTGAIVEEFAATDTRVRLVRGVEPTTGWVGKQHALQQGLALLHLGLVDGPRQGAGQVVKTLDPLAPGCPGIIGGRRFGGWSPK